MLKLAGWKPLPRLGVLRSQAACGVAALQEDCNTDSVDNAVTVPSTASAQQLSAVESAAVPAVPAEPSQQQVPHPPGHVTVAELAQVSEVQPDDHPDSTQRSDKEVHGTSLEDGEVHDASGRTSDAESGEVSDGAIAEDQQDAASPEATVKRKRQRGERAGKQVRRRQARRLRNIELGLLVHDGTRVGPGASKSKSDATKTAKPTCKYYLFGKCSKGAQCPFPHTGIPITRWIECRYFKQGQCEKGDDCQYSHQALRDPCKQLVLTGSCRFGNKCHFSHDPLPEYSIAPLQEWFREQDQLKQSRCVRPVGEQMLGPHQYPQQVTSTTCTQDTADDEHNIGNDGGDCAQHAGYKNGKVAGIDMPAQQSGLMGSAYGSEAQLHYSSWTDGWRKLFSHRVKSKKRRAVAAPDPASFAPLSGPYTSWNDGWKILFAQDTVMTQ